MKKVIIAIIMLSLNSVAIGQSIKGIVFDTDSIPIEYANVLVYNLSDSVFLKGTITNSTGEFVIEGINPIQSFISITKLGYIKKNISANKLHIVILEEDIQMLDDLIVYGKQPQYSIKNEAIVVNVDNTILKHIGTLADVIKQLPTIIIHNDNLEVLGKGRPTIYIDNIEIKNISELEKINSANIKNIELITNPSSSYDSSVKAIIKVYTKNKEKDLLSAYLYTNYKKSKVNNFQNQLDINYNNNKLNIFGSITYMDKTFLQDSKMNQEIIADTLWQYNNLLNARVHRINTDITIGGSYSFNKNHELGFKYILSLYHKDKQHSTNSSTMYASDNLYDKVMSVEQKKKSNNPANLINLYYIRKIGALNIDLTQELLMNSSKSSTKMLEYSNLSNNRIIQSKNSIDNRSYITKLNLSYPILKGSLSMGSDYKYTNRNDDYYLNNSLSDQSKIVFKEYGIGIYSKYSINTPIAEITVGLRYENIKNDYSNIKSVYYKNFFPNFSLSKKFKSVYLQLAYSAKINRPTYTQLSNNKIFVNRFTVQQGNPLLKSSIIKDLTLTGVWKFINLMISYKNEKDAILFWTTQSPNDPKISLVSFRNINNCPILTSFLSVSPSIGLWNPQLRIGITKQWIKLNNNNELLKLNKPMLTAGLFNLFYINPNLLLTVNTSFTGKGNYQNIYMNRNVLYFDIGITKYFMNKKIRIKINAYDIFKENKPYYTLYNEAMRLDQSDYRDSRKIEVSISYNLNSSKYKYKGKPIGENERNRL